jgi:predicted small integral membrane protein
MRHVLALGVSKAVLVFAIVFFYTILVLNNITDNGPTMSLSVLIMDSTLPGNHLMWRAVNSPLVHTVSTSASSPGNQSLCFYAGGLLFGC